MFAHPSRRSISSKLAIRSVIDRQLQSSLWPTILRTDSVNSRHVAHHVSFLAGLSTAAVAILSIAGFVTPLGLRDAIEPSDTTSQVRFEYVPDASAFGYGTPPRYNRFSRLCGSLLPMNCPGAFAGYLTFENETGLSSDRTLSCRHRLTAAGAYNLPVTPDAIINTTIPSNLTEIFSSATSGPGNTLSGPFDIQFRTWSVTVDTGSREIDGGRPYATGEFRSLDSLVLRNAVVPIEGAIADMTAGGGLGYRNHSVPVGLPYGGTWHEDLTWIEPVTECVDTNLTFHFSMGDTAANMTDVFLVDNGGFVNLEPHYPYPGPWNDTQNPDLRARAYKGAWFSNILTAVFLNVTYPGAKKMDSFLGRQFDLGTDLFSYHPDMQAISLSDIDGSYLQLGQTSNTTGLNLTATGQAHMSVTWDNFTDAGILCQGWGPGDYANITNVGIRCGYLFSAPRRVDGVESLIFEPKTNYTQNLYVCATGLRASVKTVGFSVNGTASLDQLKVTSIAHKSYPDNESMPLWAVEKSNMTISSFSPLWGIVDDRYETDAEGLWTLRAKQLWLPAAKDRSVSISGDSLAAPYIFQGALYSAYTESTGGTQSAVGIADYSGKTNLALYKLWTDLSQTPGDASKIINLIFTELAATATVGTKGDATTTASDSSSMPAVTQYTKKIKYNLLYGIPAILILLAVVVIATAAFFMWMSARFSLVMMRQLLNQTATGRVATNLLYPTLCDPAAGTKQWVAEAGQTKLSFAVVSSSGQTAPASYPLMQRAPTLTFPRVGSNSAPLYALIRESSHEKDAH